MLKELKDEVKKIMLGKVHNIVMDTRNGNMSVVEEKSDGDSATNADIEIGQLFVKSLPNLLPNSIVINEEDFDENVYKKIQHTQYVWVVDPIDGTKAFRTPNNNEYCVAVALLENLKPVLSVVYAPEFEFAGEKGLLFEATNDENGAKVNGKMISVTDVDDISKLKCINHIHRATERDNTEQAIANLCKESEFIRAYDGHSTLVNYALVVADNLQRVFTRRGANIWDIIQSAYLIEKAGGCVYYPNGKNIFPLEITDLEFKDNKLLMPFNIASAKGVKDKIIREIN